MDSQDHKTTAASAGHEGHGVPLCHRCGWPFPNPHPSARHRRAHKKVCGTIEGYKIINSEEHDYHLAVSDDEHGSDEDEHTPSPMVVKKNAEFGNYSGGLGGKSNKSEDDLFSDAVTDFSDSGISPRLEERFESVKRVDKNVEEKSVESDLYVNDLSKVDENAVNADRTENFNDPTKSDETSNSGALVNANDQSGSVIPKIDTSAEAASVGFVNGLQLEHKSEIPRDVVVDNVNECGDGHKQGEEDKLASVTVESKEGKISDSALTATERAEESCDKSVSELVEHDLPPQKEMPQNLDACAEVKSVAHSVEISGSTGTVGEMPLTEETHENIDTSVGLKEVSDSTEDMPSVKPSDVTELSDKVSIDKEVNLVEGKNGCNFDGNENQNLDSKKEDTFAREDDQTTKALKKDEDHCEESSKSKLLEARNEKGEGASVEEVQLMPDSELPMDKSTDIPSSDDARNLEELSKNESGSLESRDIGIEKSVQELGTYKVSEVLQSVDSELKRDTADALDKSSLPAATVEDPVSREISQLPNNVRVTNNEETVTNSEAVASQKTLEEPVPKESIPLFTNSESSSKNSAYDNSCIVEGAKASESVTVAEVIAEQTSESPTPTVEESLAVQKCLGETSPAVEEKNSVEHINASNSIVPSEELTYDSNVVTSDKCLKDSQDLHETPVAVDDKNISNVELDSGVDSKCLQDEVKQKYDVSATDLSGSSCSISDSLEGNFGSVSALSSQSNTAVAEMNSQSPDTLGNNSHEHKTAAEEAHPNKPDDLEPPSFMTLVQSGGEGDKVTAGSEIETVQQNQQPKSDALRAAWFPSLTNVVNESEGRKKNEEMIAKVTNWSPGKPHSHGPLKNLLNEVNSPNEKQVPPAAANPKDEPETKDNGAGVTKASSVLGPAAPPATNKDVEEWNSPARYPIEIKKEKKKKSYWVPFVCCSSVHRDL